jgi:hypothetical protein
MGWIERIWGISPDGGTGATEAMLVAGLGLVVAAAVLAMSRSVRRRTRKS